MTAIATARPGADAGVDTLRGLACVLLVLFHVVGLSAETGMKLADSHPLRLFVEFFSYVRMPLFAALAGFVYGWKPVRPGGLAAFGRGKLRRLAAPWVIAAVIFWAVSTVTGSGYAVAPGDAWRIFAFGYAHFWFLQAILVLFAVVALADVALPRRPLAVAAGLFAAFAGLSLSGLAAPIEVFSFNSAVYLAPYFMAGLLIQRIGGRLPAPARWIALGLLVSGLGLHGHLMAEGGVGAVDTRGVLALVVGLSAIATLLSFRVGVPGLSWIGGFSFTIYLYHLLVVAGARKVLDAVGPLPTALDLLAGLALGLAVPIAMELVLRRRGLLSTLILGHAAPTKIKTRGEARLERVVGAGRRPDTHGATETPT